jgi:hypothetical protein
MSLHSFEVEHAKRYGLAEAVLIKNFKFWIEHNIDQKYNFKDGRTWTYISLKELAKNFDYLSEKQVRTAIDHLIKDEVLLKGNYNKLSIDKTLWYAFVNENEFVKSYDQKEKPSAQMGKPSDQEGKAIPNTLNIYSNTNTNTNNITAKKSKNSFVPPTLEEVKVFFRENGYTEEVAIRAFKHYEENDWKDSYNNKVLNWKSKMRNNWFKDQYKIQESKIKVRDTFGSIHFKTQEEIDRAEPGFLRKI